MTRNNYKHRPIEDTIWIDHDFAIESAQTNIDVILPNFGNKIWGNINTAGGAGDITGTALVIKRIKILYTSATDTTFTNNIRLGSVTNINLFASNLYTTAGKSKGDIDVFENTHFDTSNWTLYIANGTIRVTQVNGSGTGSFKVGIDYTLDHTESNYYAYS